MAERELSSLPSLRTLYPKALAGSTAKPVLKRVPGLGGRFGAERELPDTELVLADARVTGHELAAYDRVCGFRLTDRLPPTYPHILAFPLSMQLMTDSSFPFAVIGLVHVRNRIEQLRPIALDEALTVRVRTGDLEPHDRGTQFRVHAEAAVAGEPVWRSESTYLRKEGGGNGGGSSGSRERTEPPAPKAVWDVPGDVGRRYADVSGDINPIHLHRLTALPFGMGRPIAHGMWMKARCLAALEGLVPDAFAVDVRFKLPLPIPAKVAFASFDEGGARAFALHDARSGKPHLEGRVEQAA